MAVITFSREAYSGTQDLARLLAQRLGYRYVGLDELAAAVKARGGVERRPPTSEHEGRALSVWEQIGEHLTGDRETYTAALTAVVTELAVADNVVVVGHGAGLVLSGMPGVLRVFVVAPMADRVARLMAEGEADAEHAQRLIEQRDRDSSEYVRHVFGIDWLDPHQWDLVINMGRASVLGALEMLSHYCAGLIRGRSDEDQLGRLQLASQIERALLADEQLGVDKLRVQADEAGIVLYGEALTESDRAQADTAARALAASTTIANRIVVHPPTTA